MKNHPVRNIVAWICACSSLGAEDLPENIQVRTLQNDEVCLYLGDDTHLGVRQKIGGTMLIVSNMDGVLSVMQVAEGGVCPVNVEFQSDAKAEIIVQRPPAANPHPGLPMVIDEDGDGIPDKKVEADEHGEVFTYQLETITWKKLPKTSKAEQGGAGEPATRVESDSQGSDKPQPESEGRSR